MTTLETWRAQLKTHLTEFAPLAKDRPHIDKIHSLIGTSLLWEIRDKRPEQLQALAIACPNEGQRTRLIEAMDGWKKRTPLEALEELDREQRKIETLKEALTTLLGYFVEDLFEEKALAPRINISGTISGGNIVIGGHQVVVGDLIITTTQQNVVTCPPLPDNPREFGGRQTEFDSLVARLKAGQTTAITAAIQGLGGIGKTTLAKKLAHHLHTAGDFRTVVWVEVNQRPNPRALLTAWAKYGESQFQDDLSLPLSSLISAAKERLTRAINTCPTCNVPQVLIILDDIWDDGIDAVQALDQARPANATLLITTRFEHIANTLNITAQKLGYLIGDGDRVAFLRAYLPPDLDKRLLIGLGDALGGYPLALKLACARAKDTKQYGSLANAIERHSAQYQKVLKGEDPFGALELERGDSKELNLSASLSLSYEELSPRDQQCWRALGMLGPTLPFDSNLLQALWQTDAVETAKICDRLLLRSLIEVSPDGEDQAQLMIYTQHPLLRSYAHALLLNAGETAEIFGRYTDHITQVTEQFFTLPPEEWDNTLAPYYPHILYVGDELMRQTKKGTAGDIIRAQAFAISITRYLEYHREVQRMEWLKMGLQAVNALQKTGNSKDITQYRQRQAVFLNETGLVWAAQGKTHKALDLYKQGLSLSRIVGDQSGEATILNNIGLALSEIGHPNEALEYFEQSLFLRRSLGDQTGTAITLNSMARTFMALGEKREAMASYEQSLLLTRATGDRLSEATALNGIGLLALELGKKTKALEMYEQALLLTQSLGHQNGEASTLNNIAGVWSAQGNKNKALAYYQQALSLYRIVEDRNGVANTLNNIASIYSERGEVEKTLAHQLEALDIVRSTGDVSKEALFSLNIAAVYHAMGRIDEAIQSVEAGKAILLQYQLPQDAGGGKVSMYDAVLNNFKDQRARAGSRQSPAQDTLLSKAMQRLAEATLAVMTDRPLKRKAHIADLTKARSQARSKANWRELQFIDILFAILDNQTLTLHPNNPYAHVVQRIITTIQQHPG